MLQKILCGFIKAFSPFKNSPWRSMKIVFGTAVRFWGPIPSGTESCGRRQAELDQNFGESRFKKFAVDRKINLFSKITSTEVDLRWFFQMKFIFKFFFNPLTRKRQKTGLRI